MLSAVATVTRLTLVKKFTYRGDANEEFSNTYWFKSPPPGNDASWTVLMNDVVAQEKKLLASDVTYVRALGHDSDDPTATHVFQYNFAIPGPPPTGTWPLPGGGVHRMAGDQAYVLRWETDALSTKGKRIYLRKFFHGGAVSTIDPDAIDSTLHAAMLAAGEAIRAIHGGLRSAARDCNVTRTIPLGYVTTRTLKRRGKKKSE